MDNAYILMLGVALKKKEKSALLRRIDKEETITKTRKPNNDTKNSNLNDLSYLKTDKLT